LKHQNFIAGKIKPEGLLIDENQPSELASDRNDEVLLEMQVSQQYNHHEFQMLSQEASYYLPRFGACHPDFLGFHMCGVGCRGL